MCREQQVNETYVTAVFLSKYGSNVRQKWLELVWHLGSTNSTSQWRLSALARPSMLYRLSHISIQYVHKIKNAQRQHLVTDVKIYDNLKNLEPVVCGICTLHRLTASFNGVATSLTCLMNIYWYQCLLYDWFLCWEVILMNKCQCLLYDWFLCWEVILMNKYQCLLYDRFLCWEVSQHVLTVVRTDSVTSLLSCTFHKLHFCTFRKCCSDCGFQPAECIMQWLQLAFKLC